MSSQFQLWIEAALTNLAFCVITGILAGLGVYPIHYDWHDALITGGAAAASAAVALFGKSYIRMSQELSHIRSRFEGDK